MTPTIARELVKDRQDSIRRSFPRRLPRPVIWPRPQWPEQGGASAVPQTHEDQPAAA